MKSRRVYARSSLLLVVAACSSGEQVTPLEFPDAADASIDAVVDQTPQADVHADVGGDRGLDAALDRATPVDVAADTLRDAKPEAKTACTPGTRECNAPGDRAIYGCSEAGTWQVELCGDDEVCVGQALCVKAACAPFETRCGATGSQERLVCSRDRSKLERADCPAGSLCAMEGNEASCAPIICTPGQTGCVPGGLGLGTCTSTGTGWTITTPCQSTEQCVSGACAKAPSPTTSDMFVYYPGYAPTEVSLSKGYYALAIVSTDGTGDDTMPLPLTFAGDLSAPTKGPVSPPPRLVAPPRATCGTKLMAARMRGVEMPRVTPGAKNNEIRRAPSVVGDEREFRVPSSMFSSNKRQGKLRAVGATVEIWDDVTGNGSNISDEDAVELADRIDRGVMPRTQAIFGRLTDVDNDGLLRVLVSDLVFDVGASAFVVPAITLYETAQFDFGEILYLGPIGDAAEMATVVAHELEHLIYFGRRYNPPEVAPAWADDDQYAGEGIAELSSLWSGQGESQLAGMALQFPSEWSMARFFADAYLSPGDWHGAGASYGHAALFLGYLFEQHGAVTVTGPGTVADKGGIAFIDQFTMSPGGWYRLRTRDGRSGQQAYVDFGAALLSAALVPGTLSTASAQNPRYSFFPYESDATFGGHTGLPVRGQARGRIRIGTYSPANTIRRGGMSFVQVAVGNAGATLRRADSTVGVAVVKLP